MRNALLYTTLLTLTLGLSPIAVLGKEPTQSPQSEAKKPAGKAKNTVTHAWVNREEGVLEQHEPIPVPEDVPFYDENDQPHIFDEFYGQVLLVNFWATWCTPCTQEMPAIAKLQHDFRRKNFKVLAISGDFKGVEAIRDFYTAHEIRNLPIYHDPKNVLAKTFGVTAFPTSLIIDAEGNEIARIFGSYVDWESEEFRQFILDHTDQKTYNVPAAIPINASSAASSETTEKIDEKPYAIPESAVTVQGPLPPEKPKERVDLANPEIRRPVNLPAK